jgi:hypothetical protein
VNKPDKRYASLMHSNIARTAYQPDHSPIPKTR